MTYFTASSTSNRVGKVTFVASVVRKATIKTGTYLSILSIFVVRVPNPIGPIMIVRIPSPIGPTMIVRIPMPVGPTIVIMMTLGFVIIVRFRSVL